MKSRVEFDKTTCCAMREAFSANVNQEELVRSKNAVGDQKFKILADIFNRTLRVGGFMENNVALFYYKVAKVELERLNLLTQTVVLSCGHKVYEHAKALENLKDQALPPQRPN